MKKVKVKNLYYEDLEALKTELDIYKKYVAVKYLATDFLQTIITFDIVNSLLFMLNTRMWKGAEKQNIIFSASQAAIILKCCNFNRTDRNTYTKHVMTKLSIDIDEKLTSLIWR